MRNRIFKRKRKFNKYTNLLNSFGNTILFYYNYYYLFVIYMGAGCVSVCVHGEEGLNRKDV